ncbi:MAG: hypothetical protein ACXACU_16400 [Candidatus Hodarchaeales archaeon]|jgi:putative transcriptional regulator
MSISEPITKEELVFQTKAEFKSAGYSLWRETPKSNIFDFIAKKTEILNNQLNDKRIITKIVVDLDLFKKQTSIELQLISKLVSGFPLLVAHSADGKNIEEETLYRRHQISAVTLKTLKKFFQFESGKSSAGITKFTHRGGVYVNLSKDKFKEQRLLRSLDMTLFAKKAKISRHSLYKYEKGESFPKTKNFEILCRILGDNLDVPLDIFETQFDGLSDHALKDYQRPRSNLQKEVGIYLAEKDFNVLWFKSEPFDGLSEPNSEIKESNKRKQIIFPIITGVTSQNEKNDNTRFLLISSISEFLRKKAIWFIEDDMDDIDSPEESPYVSVVNVADLEGMALIDFLTILKRQKPSIFLKKNK